LQGPQHSRGNPGAATQAPQTRHQAPGQDAVFEEVVELVPDALRPVGFSSGLNWLEQGRGMLLHRSDVP